MLHPTYKHLEDCIRLAGLSLAQWSQLFVCALGAFGLSKLLPLPGSWAVSAAITVCGLPAAGAVAFMQADFDVRRWLSDAARFQRGPRRYLAGVGGSERAALVGSPTQGSVAAAAVPPDVDGLWDAA